MTVASLLDDRARAVADRDLEVLADTTPTGDPYVDLVRAGTRRLIAEALRDDAMRAVDAALVAAVTADRDQSIARLAELGGVSRPTAYAAIPTELRGAV